MNKTEALAAAEHGARYKHGTWFAWQDTSGEWHAGKVSVAALEPAARDIHRTGKVYMIGGGGRHSMVFTRFRATMVDMWLQNVEAMSAK